LRHRYSDTIHTFSRFLQYFVSQLLPLTFPPQAMATKYKYLNHLTPKQSDHIWMDLVQFLVIPFFESE
ncbi:hypothetical protein BC826DRAFT_991044, partial [Russula brevipes]